MKLRLHYLGLLAFALPCEMAAQWAADVERPRLFHLQTIEECVQLNVETQNETRTSSGSEVRRDYQYIEPTVSANFLGSIYHPNLLEFQFRPELGYSWQNLGLVPPGGSVRSGAVIDRFDGTLSILRAKPYASSLFAEKGRSYQTLDFFSRDRVDTLRYGGHTGYTKGIWTFKCDATHLDQEVSGGLRRSSNYTDDTLVVGLSRGEQGKTRTELAYTLDSFTRTEADFAPISGSAETASIYNMNYWGLDDWIRLSSLGMLNRMRSGTYHTRSLIGTENLGLQFRSNFSGDALYNINDQQSESVKTTTQEARASLRHQLYKSLASVFTVQGASSVMNSPDGHANDSRMGLALEETYTKTLPRRSRLVVSGNWRGDKQQRRTSGHIIQIESESITLNDTKTTFLSQQSVVTVTRVTNAIGVDYVETLDYVLVRHGTMMEIRRVPGGNIANGSLVLVSYSANTLPSGDYTTIMQGYQVRLELFENLLAFYARLNRVDNSSGTALMLRDYNDTVFGAEIQWHWLTAGAEHERMSSNISPYNQDRIFATAFVPVWSSASLSVTADQSWASFPDTGRTRRTFSCIGRFQQQLNPFFYWHLESGLLHETGDGIDQNRAALRAGLTYNQGKLSVSLSYDFDDENMAGELHRRMHTYLRIKRSF